MDDIFKGTKVLELSSVLAGPLVGSFFAELGAQVTKVENKTTGGDVTRNWRLKSESTNDVSAYYASANYGKEVLMLDFKNSEDRKLLLSEIRSADIITTNIQKRTAEKLNVDLEFITSINPKVIICQLNAYTYDDPRPGYDLVMQAESGLLSMTGSDGANLAKVPVAIVDVTAAHQMKEAILVAMLQRASSGKGQTIHVSLYKSALSILVNQASNYLMAGHIPKPMGTLHPNIAPYGDIVTTKDGVRIVLAVGSNGQFANLLKSLTFAPERYLGLECNEERLRNRTKMLDLLCQDFARIDSSVALSQLADAKVPHCVIQNMAEVMKDPIAQEMVLEDHLDDQVLKRMRNLAFRIVEFPEV